MVREHSVGGQSSKTFLKNDITVKFIKQAHLPRDRLGDLARDSYAVDDAQPSLVGEVPLQRASSLSLLPHRADSSQGAP